MVKYCVNVEEFAELLFWGILKWKTIGKAENKSFTPSIIRKRFSIAELEQGIDVAAILGKPVPLFAVFLNFGEHADGGTGVELHIGTDVYFVNHRNVGVYHSEFTPQSQFGGSANEDLKTISLSYFQDTHKPQWLEVDFLTYKENEIIKTYVVETKGTFNGKTLYSGMTSFFLGEWDLFPRQLNGYVALTPTQRVIMPQDNQKTFEFKYRQKKPGVIEQQYFEGERLFRVVIEDDLELGEHIVKASNLEPPNLYLHSDNFIKVNLTAEKPKAVLKFYYKAR